MKKLESSCRFLPWLMLLLLSALVSGCGGGGSDVTLGNPPPAPITAIAPTVTAVAPVNNGTGVPLNLQTIALAFSEPMAPITNASTITVSCAVSCANPTGTVTLDASSINATFALTPGTTLVPNMQYTVTVTGARSLVAGLPLVNPYVWQFKTGSSSDVTRPRVNLTVPATASSGSTSGVQTNTAISAAFSEQMNPATLNAAGMMVSCAAPCVSPVGAVSYSVANQTAVFTPAVALAPNTTYTATVNQSASDLAGNTLGGNQASLPAASNYVWTFTTGPMAGATANISVLSTNPVANALGQCPSTAVSATFSVPSGLRMDPATVNTSTFSMIGPSSGSTPVIAASVVLDAATGQIATFTPQSPLVSGGTYVVTIKSGANGVKDLAVPADTLAGDVSWNLTVGSASGSCLAPISLGSAASFGTFGGSAGMTNSGLLTVINGNIGTTAVSTAVTGFHDAGPGCTYTETPLNAGTVNGNIDTAAPPPTSACSSEGTATTFAAATLARADALAAYNQMVALPGGPDPGAGNLANLVLAPGVYTAASGSFRIQGGNLTLDAQGNANAVWVFQMASTLTVGGPGAAFPQSITLVNGAQAKNVFWQVGTAATINAGGGGTMVGTLIAQAGVPFSTAGNTTVVTLNGRVLSLGASVTLVNTVINVPAQ